MSTMFTFGTMKSGKSAQILIDYTTDCFNKKNTILIKPAIDTRDNNYIKTRFGDVKHKCQLWDQKALFIDLLNDKPYDTIYVDECQFLTAKQVQQLRLFSFDNPKTKLKLYGLLTDYNGKMFDGTKYVLEFVDKLKQIESHCWCGKIATKNKKTDDNEDNEIISIGDHYIPVCEKHFTI